MADEEVMQETPEVQSDQEQEAGPGPGPKLSDADKGRLYNIISRMEAAKESTEDIKGVVARFKERYGKTDTILSAQPDYRQPIRQDTPAETTASPVNKIETRLGTNFNTDPATVARQQKYQGLRDQSIKEVESPNWKDKIFTGKVPALTQDQNMPEEAFQKVDPKAVEQYLSTKDLNDKDRYWLRNQIINYGDQRHSQYYIEQRAQKNLESIPLVKHYQDLANRMVIEKHLDPSEYEDAWKGAIAAHPELKNEIDNAYATASKQYAAHQTEAIANKLNNVGLDDKPISSNAPFHDQITGTNKALMGAINYAGDLGHQISSLLELGGVPGLSDIGYKLKTDADNLKARNEIPQNGEAGNLLAGDILPMALDMEALRRLSGAAGKPIYQSLAKARATGAMGQFAEGALGGLAISPANSYLMAHQYYNDLVKQGMDPAAAASKSDQLLVKNITTDMLMTPVQMGLMRIGGGSWGKKALTNFGEGVASGAVFTAQDFNQKSTENPALHVMDYLHNDPDAKKTFVSGAVLGMLQKSAVDHWHNWDVHSETKNMFSYGRQYNSGDNKSLPGNKVIANNILGAIEMKDTPGRVQELKDLTESLQQSGVYNPKEAANINKIIDDVAAVRKQVPKFGKPEQRMAVMNELLEQHAAERYTENAGHDAAGGPIKDKVKESDERIKRIMAGQEPLYFINGNETNKEQLIKAIEDDPSLVGSKGAKIKVINDATTIDKIKELKSNYDALQKQKPATNDVRPASGDSEAVGGRNESQGAIDQKTAGESPVSEAKKPDHVLEARHSLTDHDEGGVVSGQNQLGLSDEGVVDAHRLKEEVQRDHAIDKVITSDLERSKETGQIVADGRMPVESRPELNSWDLKDFGGMKDGDFKPIQKWFAEHPEETTYKGDIEEAKGKKLGESLNDYAKRAIDARQKVEDEGPGTFLVSHSNNMNIWEAYKENGNKWDENAIKDFLSMKTPEPAEIVRTPEENDAGEAVNAKIESGEIPDDTLKKTAKLFIEYEKGNEPIFPVSASDAGEAGNSKDDGAVRQFSKATGAPQHVPSPGGTASNQPNQSAQSLSGNTGTADPARLTKNAKQLIIAGRTDEQIMTYLQRKGMDPAAALAALGIAKANPINEQQKAASLAEVKKTYFGKEGDWLGRKELNKVNSQQTTREYQDAIKESVKKDPTQKGKNWKDVDKAIHIYLDTQANPSHFQDYYPKLTPEQKRIADLSQNLTSDQKDIAQAIKEEYEAIGQQAKDAGVIKDVIDNYVARAWEMGGKPATEESFKGKTTTRHSLERTLDTILQGQAEGMKLKIEGATNNFQILKQEIGNVIENKRHLDEGLKLKIDTGEVDAKGKPVTATLFSTSQRAGYKKIENPMFRKWEYAGKIQEHPEQDAQVFGRRRDVLVTEDGTVMKKSDVYAPEEVAKSLNNILGNGKLTSLQGLLKFNAAVKQSILSYSGFHFIAFTRAHILSAKLSTPKAVNPITAYKAGLSMLAEQHPVGQELIKNGMTINRQQDYMEGVNNHNTWVGKQMDKLAFTKVAKDKLIDLNTQFHKYLFNTYGAGLKMFDGINMAKAEMAKSPGKDPKEVYARVAKLMNDTYGGINWDRMHGTKMQDPTFRQISSMLLLAPDWTASNLRFAKKAIARGDEAALYRKSWARVALRGVMLTTAANAIMAVWDDKDDEGNPLSWTDAMARRYSKAWEVGKLRSTMIDITPLYHAIGGPSDKRAYFSVFGAYTDPIKMIANPIDFLESKGSYVSKLALEGLTSQNWQHKEFTTVDELLGMDDKGVYAKGQTAHDKGDINSSTGLPYKKTQEAHDEGDEKGGKLAFPVLTKWPKGGAHPVTWWQAPSFIGSQIRGLMPTAVQNAWQIASGENDATTGLLNAVGSSVYTSKEPKKE